MAGRKVGKDHVIETENNQESLAESLLQQQEDIVYSEPDVEEIERKSDVEPVVEQFLDVSEDSNVLILTKAATYYGCGLHFKKNDPTKVTDTATRKILLNTGLFKEGGI